MRQKLDYTYGTASHSFSKEILVDRVGARISRSRLSNPKVELLIDLAEPQATPSLVAVRTRPAISECTRVRKLRPPSGLLVACGDVASLAAPAIWSRYAIAQVSFSLLAVVIVALSGLYRPRLEPSALDLLPTALERTLVSAAIVSTVVALSHQPLAVGGVLIGALSGMAILVVGRYVTARVVRLVRRVGLVRYRTLLIGAGPQAQHVARALAVDPTYGLAVTGYVADLVVTPEADRAEMQDIGVPCIGDITFLDGVLADLQPEVLVVGSSGFSDSDVSDVLRKVRFLRCDVFVIPRLLDGRLHGLERIGAVPVARVTRNQRSRIALTAKRLLDICVAVSALAALAPILLACALAVRIDGGPGIIFRQVRVGRDGRRFNFLKFRSMNPETVQAGDTTWSVANDARVSRLGRLMRRTSADELPQLWNVLRGDMSLVGPRPERPFFVKKFAAEIPDYELRHRLPCGLTGLAQVSGLRGDTSIADRARYDNYHIEHWCLWMDIEVLARTVREVLARRGG